MTNFTTHAPWHRAVFDGQWSPTNETIPVRAPATGALIDECGLARPADVSKAAELAADRGRSWFQMAFDERARVLRNAAALLEKLPEAVIATMMQETGSTRPKIDFELKVSVTCLLEAAAMPSQPQGLILPSYGDRISMCRRQPLGVVGVISPFNFPFYLSLRAIAPALAVGNSVIVKPDPRTPISGGFVLASIFEEAGLPHGVLHVLPGGADVGEALCTDRNVAMIQFTGSTRAGRKVAELAGASLKKVSLELGGKNSLIILDDADVELAAANAAWGAFLHQGQICMASGRILVHSKIADALTERLVDKANRLTVGDPSDPTNALGPLITQSQRDRARRIVEDSVASGARLHAGGTFDGLFYRPTVLGNISPGMQAFDEEFFAPIAAVTTFADDEEAISLANRTDYGLACGIISRSVGRAMAVGNRIRTGLLHINDQTVGEDGVNPFGGRGASGNGTSIGGPANWDEFSVWQWVTIKDQPPAYPI